MTEEFEYKGLWYLPFKPEKKVPGILRYNYKENVNVLELIGTFYEHSDHDGEEIILGLTTDGDEITLVNCNFKSSTGIPRKKNDLPNWKEDRQATLNFRISTILKNVLISKKEDLLFQQVYVEIFNLDEWIGISGIDVDHDSKHGSHTIYYNTPDEIKVSINEDIDMQIKFVSNHPMRFRFTKELALTQRTILSFHSKQSLQLEDFIHLIRKFNNFLSASLQTPVRIETMEIYCDKYFDVLSNGYELKKQIKVFQIFDNKLKFKEKKVEWNMLFCYNDIKVDFDTIIKKWFSNYDKFESPFNLVLRQFYLSEYYLESMFINVAHAAEGFQSRLEISDNTVKDEQDEEIKEKWNKVAEFIPEELEDLKKWLKSKIPKKEQYHYSTRIKYLLKEYSNTELNNMIGNHDSFVKNLNRARNYYSHYYREMEKNAPSGVDLIDLLLRLRLLLICAFLIESGFDKALLEKLIKEKTYSMFRDLYS